MADGSVTLQQLKQRIIDSGLLSADVVRTAESSIVPVPESSQDFARELVRQRKLSDYQADVLLEVRAEFLTPEELLRDVPEVTSSGQPEP